MSRRARFNQADAARALRAAVAAGLIPSGFTVAPDGSIHVEVDCGTAAPKNPLDRVLPS